MGSPNTTWVQSGTAQQDSLIWARSVGATPPCSYAILGLPECACAGAGAAGARSRVCTPPPSWVGPGTIHHEGSGSQLGSGLGPKLSPPCYSGPSYLSCFPPSRAPIPHTWLSTPCLRGSWVSLHRDPAHLLHLAPPTMGAGQTGQVARQQG